MKSKLLHEMEIENVFGTRLNLCKNCGAHLDKKKIWHLAGYESTTEPPCLKDAWTKESRKNFEQWKAKGVKSWI